MNHPEVLYKQQNRMENFRQDAHLYGILKTLCPKLRLCTAQVLRQRACRPSPYLEPELVAPK